jgi:Transposase DDE domain
MAFVTEKEELKPGLIIFRRGDIEHRMWYCRMKIPKVDRYKTISLKTSDLDLARERALGHEADIRLRLKYDVPVFTPLFREVGRKYLLTQEARVRRGEISAARPRKLRAIIEGVLDRYAGSAQVHLIGNEAQCLAVGLVRGDKLSVDGTFVEANASKESRIPREQLAEAAQVNRTVREYLAELELQNPVEEPTHSQDKVSTTDPDSTYATKGGTPARMGYYNNYLIDNHSCIVVGVQATGARLSEESRAAENMIARFAQWRGSNPQSIAADASYGNGQFLQWLMDREITPYMPTRDAVGRTRSPLYGPESFTYLPDSNSYICPAGQQLNYGGRNEGNRTFGYIGTRKKCGPCQQRSQCTTGPFRYLAIHMNEAARQRARDLWSTEEFKHAQRQRKKVEALFAELKSHSHIGLNRLRLRRLKFVREQFFLAATAQNIKRLVRFLSRPTMSPVPATS